MRLAGLILAAGASRRMGRAKALLEYRGETFVDHLIGLLGAVCEPVIVVLGTAAAEIRGASRRGAVFVTNPEPERGQTSSLQCGLRAVPADCGGVLFTPVDCPAVQPATMERLAEALRQGRPLAVPVCRGRRGHPVGVSRGVAAELLALEGDTPATVALHGWLAQAALVEVEDGGVLGDVDDAEAYRRLLGEESGR